MIAKLSNAQIDTFRQSGFLVLPKQTDLPTCAAIQAVVNDHLARAVQPLEYEADVGYEGAPASRDVEGGKTIRRLRNAWQRHTVFQQWASNPDLVHILEQLLEEPVMVTLSHHNSIMTKHPTFGTATGWHRDIRYWSFPHNNLISVWLALGPEDTNNGGLHFIPGSHLWKLHPEQMDDLDFLRPDYPENQTLIQQNISVPLEAGDVILFHSGLFHAAGRNNTNKVKSSVVFAYNAQSNPPLPNTRSSQYPDILLSK